MKIGICYDTKEEYGFETSNLNYTDFVSLELVSEIKRTLEDIGHDVEYIGNIHSLIAFIEKEQKSVDYIFNMVEGCQSRNRVALIPAYLEAKKIMHNGSDTFATALVQNKYFTKILVRNIQIKVPEGFIYKEINPCIIAQALYIGFPLIIKPNNEGGGMGVKLVTNKEEFIRESNYMIKNFNHELLCEKYIEGKELTVPIIGNGEKCQALGVISIVNSDHSDIKVYDAALKQNPNVVGIVEFGCPEVLIDEIKKASIAIHNFFGLHDYSRMDYKLDKDGNFYFLEANLLPFLNRKGSFEICAKQMGKTYQDVIEWIVNAGLKRYGVI